MILYGRRRIGKTRLLTHWATNRPQHKTLYWVAQSGPADHHLASFSRDFHQFIHGEDPGRAFTYGTWEDAFITVAKAASQTPITLMIDEVNYIMDVDETFAGVVQKTWDHHLKMVPITIIFSGSKQAHIRDMALDKESPLYGRATDQLELQPLRFEDSKTIFPTFNAKERLAIYAMLGGVPAYWERIYQDRQQRPLEDVILNNIFSSSYLMKDEQDVLLGDLVSDPHNYIAILRAIAHGHEVQREISTFSGLPQGHVSKYIGVLRNAGLVDRETSTVAIGSAGRTGRYLITDPYTRFYYRCLYDLHATIARGNEQAALRQVMDTLPEFIRSNAMPEICREWVNLASLQTLPLMEPAGRVWTTLRGNLLTAPIAAASIPQRTVVLGDVLFDWADTPHGKEIVTEFVNRSQVLASTMIKNNADTTDTAPWNLILILVSATGWDDEAALVAKSIPLLPDGMVSEKSGSDALRITEVRLMTLGDIERDLIDWRS